MRILALETSTRDATVAVLEDERLIQETDFGADQRTAQAFAPAIARQLASVGWRPRDIQLIAVSRGPGSFTGLRVGVTAAKTLAYATGAAILGIDTMHVIAAQVEGPWREIVVVVDAQRQQLCEARFRRNGPQLEAIESSRIVGNQQWLDSLAADRAVTGPALSRLRDRLPARAIVVPAENWSPRASTVGRVGYLDYLSGRRDDFWKLVPYYHRQSAAEEKLAAKET
jgi:tRNA threonylcarbamoyladenosine biosynthesis protein TsaB